MPLAAVITIIGAVLTVLVLAGYLISVVLVLRRVDAALRAANANLRLVTERAEPAGGIVGEINSDLAGVDTALRRVLAK
jgi:hypothetical protein